MYIAQQKRKENLAEYILYMFQVEDLIRAFKLDTGLIKDHLISRYELDDGQYEEVEKWYGNLVAMMQNEGVVASGHFQFLVNLINDLNEFHLKIIKNNISPDYTNIFNAEVGLINEFRLKGNASANDIETCLNGIYGYLLLKMQGKKVSDATGQAVKQFGKLLGMLSALYKKWEEGGLEL